MVHNFISVLRENGYVRPSEAKRVERKNVEYDTQRKIKLFTDDISHGADITDGHSAPA